MKEGSSKPEGTEPMDAQPASKAGGSPRGGRGSNPLPSSTSLLKRRPVIAFHYPNMVRGYEVMFDDGYSRHHMMLDNKTRNFVCTNKGCTEEVTEQTIREFLRNGGRL